MKKNVLSEAYTAIAFRTMGDEEYGGRLLSDRISAVLINFKIMFLSNGKRPILLLFFLIMCLLVAALIQHKMSKINNTYILLSLIVILYPYIWYFVVSNHSLIHASFTFKSQVAVVFAVIACILNSTDCSSFDIMKNLQKKDV